MQRMCLLMFEQESAIQPCASTAVIVPTPQTSSSEDLSDAPVLSFFDNLRLHGVLESGNQRVEEANLRKAHVLFIFCMLLRLTPEVLAGSGASFSASSTKV